MITIMPIEHEVLRLIAEELGLTAEGPVWGYIASDGLSMLGFVVVEKQEPVRIIGLRAEDPSIADGLLRRALHPLYEEGAQGYTFACPVEMPLPMAYTRSGTGDLSALFHMPCHGAKS